MEQPLKKSLVLKNMPLKMYYWKPMNPFLFSNEDEYLFKRLTPTTKRQPWNCIKTEVTNTHYT
jgi:hypothetical protein